MFHLSQFPADTRSTFRKGAILWPLAVTQATDGGVKNVDDLTNLVFFMHHPERMTGDTGRALDPKEADFQRLADEWTGFRSMVRPMVAAPSGGTSSGSGKSKSLAEEFTDFVKDVRKGGGVSLSTADQAKLEALLKGRSVDEVKMMEWILVLWPSFGHPAKMNRMIEMVTGAIRRSDKEESSRGRFDEKTGSEIHARLSKAAKQTKFGQCLNFLANEGLPELFADEKSRLADALKRYRQVAKERKEQQQAHGGGTLSIMASEMRLEGLVGPVTVLSWTGSADKGHHTPDPVSVFDRLSSAGDGWYFFLASAVSFHTFLVAVHVSSGGVSREYFEIQDGQSVRKTPRQLKDWFDKEFLPNTEKASSRIWQIYLKPAD
jgi:hypothetical protein